MEIDADVLFDSQQAFIFQAADQILNLFRKLIHDNPEENFGVCATSVSTAVSLALSRFIKEGIEDKKNQSEMVDIIAENTRSLLRAKYEDVGESWYSE